MANSREEILKIASAQKMLLWTILLAIAIYSYSLVLEPAVQQGLVPRSALPIAGLFFFVGVITIVVLQISSVIRLCLALEEGWATVIYVIMQFVPCFSLLFLLFLNSRATNRLKAAGIGVGFMGANSQDLKNYHPASPEKCPACGEPIDATEIQCPMCGAEVA